MRVEFLSRYRVEDGDENVVTRLCFSNVTFSLSRAKTTNKQDVDAIFSV